MSDPEGAVVVGAGVAGLAAAAELARRGIAVRLLEARERCGGRISTVRAPGRAGAIELGAEFLHGEAPETRKLLAAAGALVCEIDGEHRAAQAGKLVRGDFLKDVDRVLGRIERSGADEPLAAFLRRRPGGPGLERARGRAAEFVEGFHAADLERISAKSLAVEKGEEASAAAAAVARVVEGYDAGVRELERRALGAGATLALRSVVHEIAWKPGAARVSGVRGGEPFEVTACAAIVTLPLGVLAAAPGSEGAVRFRPDPAGLRRALARLEMGSALRLILDFAEPPWLTRAARARGADERLAFLHFTGEPFQAAWTAYPLSPSRVTFWSGGPRARELARRGDGEVTALALRLLAGALGTPVAKLRHDLAGAWIHDWDADPFARGAYSYAAVGGAGAAKAFGRPIADTLYFAGEATAEGENGTVEGALKSGLRAARQAAAALGRVAP